MIHYVFHNTIIVYYVQYVEHDSCHYNYYICLTLLFQYLLFTVIFSHFVFMLADSVQICSVILCINFRSIHHYRASLLLHMENRFCLLSKGLCTNLPACGEYTLMSLNTNQLSEHFPTYATSEWSVSCVCKFVLLSANN